MHIHEDSKIVRMDNGLIHAWRVDHHPAVQLDDEEDWDFGYCAICSAYVWLSAKAVIFSNMNPVIPILCCRCSELSREAVEAAVPDFKFMERDVPDLARLGMFN